MASPCLICPLLSDLDNTRTRMHTVFLFKFFPCLFLDHPTWSIVIIIEIVSVAMLLMVEAGGVVGLNEGTYLLEVAGVHWAMWQLRIALRMLGAIGSCKARRLLLVLMLGIKTVPGWVESSTLGTGLIWGALTGTIVAHLSIVNVLHRLAYANDLA